MATTPCPEADGSSQQVRRFKSPPPMCIDPERTYTATMTTTKGTMTIALDAVGAPKTVNNFVFLARYHYYDGIVFHRIIPGFMLQGGDPDGSGRGGPGYRFDDEVSPSNIPHRHQAGSLSMANAGSNTNGSQFFIVYDPQPHLDGKHTIFGQVTSGMDVARSLKNGDKMESVTINES